VLLRKLDQCLNDVGVGSIDLSGEVRIAPASKFNVPGQ
jgi:hypothetical protein